MSLTFDLSSVADLRDELSRHSVYSSLRTLDDVRGFIEHHVFSVWDFMPLLKCLQHAIAPTACP